MTIRIEVQNLEEVKRILEQLGARAEAALPQAIEEGAKVLVDRVAANAPGPFIDYQMDGKTAYVGPDKAHFYYAFFETGTNRHFIAPTQKRALHWGGDAFSAGHAVGGIAAAPFMRPAVDEGGDEVAEAVGAVLAAALE